MTRLIEGEAASQPIVYHVLFVLQVITSYCLFILVNWKPIPIPSYRRLT